MLGSLVSRAAVERIGALIKDAVAKGAVLVTGGASATDDDGRDGASTG